MAITNKNLGIKIKKNKEQLRARDNEIVRGMFKFDEVPGGTLVFSYRKWKKDLIRNYSFIDGETYEIPRGVAKHLASTGSYPVHEYQTDTNGKAVVRIGRRKRRYSFESLGFFDDIEDEHTSVGHTSVGIKPKESNIFTVEKL